MVADAASALEKISQLDAADPEQLQANLQAIVDAGVLTQLVALLDRPAVCTFALQALANISRGDALICQNLINSNMLPAIKPLLRKTSTSAQNHAAVGGLRLQSHSFQNMPARACAAPLRRFTR